jgi:argininosuccinate lyase
MQKDTKLWGGRFCEDVNQNLASLNCSLGIDQRLFDQDITGSKAYAEILCDAELLTKPELDQILEGLEQVRSEWLNGTILFTDSDEDVHSVNERRLIEIIGAAGGKLHTGRSRNDQVIVDMKMWLKESVVCLAASLESMINVMIVCARENISILFPGYTHLQRAQPVRFSHWLLSHAFAVLVRIFSHASTSSD